MRRMLQGEVGSGKTLVALISLFAVINSGSTGCYDGSNGNISRATLFKHY